MNDDLTPLYIFCDLFLYKRPLKKQVHGCGLPKPSVGWKEGGSPSVEKEVFPREAANCSSSAWKKQLSFKLHGGILSAQKYEGSKIATGPVE